MDKKSKKHSFAWHGKTYYFLGYDAFGCKQYLEKANWDCDWYWGIGYVETFSNNRNPSASNDIRCHTQFYYLFEEIAHRDRLYNKDAFNVLFRGNPFSVDEVWQILELMRSAYTAQKYAEMLHLGGSHVTKNPVRDEIVNQDEWERINQKVIPALMEALYKILEGDAE